MKDGPRTLVILPCYNEQHSIGGVLDEVAAAGFECDTLVVDDGSQDKTYEVARAKSFCVRLSSNLGIGGAVQTGFKYGVRRDYNVCIQIDGDGQHPPDQIQILLEKYTATGANIVIGSRYLLNDTFRSTRLRRAGSVVIAAVMKVLFGGLRVTDPTSGMRLMDQKAMRLFALNYPADFPEPISLAWAACRGLRIKEVPVQMRARTHGRSSILGIGSVAYMIRVLGYMILARLTMRPFRQEESLW